MKINKKQYASYNYCLQIHYIKYLLGKIKMNSSLVAISIPGKSNISRQCLINFFIEVSNQSLRSCLRLPKIYDGNCNKKKTDLIEMIVYGCITNKLNEKRTEDISLNKAYAILKEKDISIKSLPGYGNLGLRKKDIKPYNDTISIKIKE